jgi:hypothetical protein
MSTAFEKYPGYSDFRGNLTLVYVIITGKRELACKLVLAMLVYNSYKMMDISKL